MFWFSLYRVQCVCFGNIIWYMIITVGIFLLPYVNKYEKYWHYWISKFFGSGSKPIYFYGLYIVRNHTQQITRPNPFFLVFWVGLTGFSRLTQPMYTPRWSLYGTVFRAMMSSNCFAWAHLGGIMLVCRSYVCRPL